MNEFSSTAVVSEVQSEDVESVLEFTKKVEAAAAFIKAAHSTQRNVQALLDVSHHGKVVGRKNSNSGTWYRVLVKGVSDRAMEIITVIENYPAEGAAIVAERTAFGLLCQLTPVSGALHELWEHDRRVACRKLSDQVVIVCSQFDKAVELVETQLEGDAKPKDFAAESNALLKEAGGAYSLSEASKSLGTSRQALHKRIHRGTALGMMIDDEIRVPKLQIVESKSGKKGTILDGIDLVVKPFVDSKAGPWAALQFLTEPDPNLRTTPLAALKDGKIEATVSAARARLGLDEG